MYAFLIWSTSVSQISHMNNLIKFFQLIFYNLLLLIILLWALKACIKISVSQIIFVRRYLLANCKSTESEESRVISWQVSRPYLPVNYNLELNVTLTAMKRNWGEEMKRL